MASKRTDGFESPVLARYDWISGFSHDLHDSGAGAGAGAGRGSVDERFLHLLSSKLAVGTTQETADEEAAEKCVARAFMALEYEAVTLV